MNNESIIIDSLTNESKSLNDLLLRVQQDDFYYEIWKYPSFFEFIVNLVKALVNNRNITLIDKDFSDEEMLKLGLDNQFAIKHKLTAPNLIKTKNELVERMISSSSIITLFTSGTTGLPKQVTHTMATLTRMVRFGEAYKSNVWGIAYNPTHMAGTQVILQALLNFNKMVYVYQSPIHTIVKTFTEHKITHISATPTFYRMLLSTKHKFNDVIRVTVGGEQSNPGLHGLMKDCFPNAKIFNIYASTELGSLFVAHGNIFVVPEALENKVKIEDNELLIHASVLGKAMDKEWYHTGDLIELIDERPLRFKFVSRTNEMINVGGYKINPNEVEDEIRIFDEIKEVRVFGKPNSVLGNILCAEVVYNNGFSLEIKELQQRLKLKLQEFKIPRIIKVVDTISSTRTGKLNRK